MARVAIDLDNPSILSVVKDRFDFIVSAARELEDENKLTEVYFNDDNARRVAESYFRLSEAYKIDKLQQTNEDRHPTEGAKKAALTTICLMVFRPFRRWDSRVPMFEPLSVVANQDLALRCASSLMERDLADNLGWSSQQRLFNLLELIGPRAKDRLRVRSLHKYIRDQQVPAADVPRRLYQIDVDPDLPLIESLILLFESPLRP